jgi:hypothetical protein
VHFESVAEVKSNGNTNMGSHYSAIDPQPAAGTSYYRLKQTNYDGQTRYSDIRVVNFHGMNNGSLTVKDFGPNPFNDSFWVTYEIGEQGPVSFQLMSSDGKMVHSEEVNGEQGSNRYEYTNKTTLEAGIYLLSIRYNGKTIVKKFIKENKN